MLIISGQKKRGRPKKVTSEETTPSGSSINKTLLGTNDTNNTLLYKISLQPHNKVQLNPDSAIKPTQHAKPFDVYFFASDQYFRKSID